MASFGSILGNIGTAVDIGSSVAGIAGNLNNAFGKPATSVADKAYADYLANKGYKGLISTGGYQFGGGNLVRRSNYFGQGQAALRNSLAQLQAQTRPGFGALTNAGVAAIRQQAASAAGNLRANLSQRGLLGASFANDAQGRVDREFQQLEQEYRAQSFQDEMAANVALIQQTQASLQAQMQADLAELGLANDFLSQINQAPVTSAAIAQQLAEEKLLKQYGQPGAKPSVAAKPAPKPAAPAQRPRFARGGPVGQQRPAPSLTPGKTFSDSYPLPRARQVGPFGRNR